MTMQPPATASGDGGYGIKRLDYHGCEIKMEVKTPLEALYRRHACAKEPWTVEFIEQLPPDTAFIDIGANTGPYTLIAASREIPTLAIEPSFESYAAMCRNLTINGWLNRAIPMCLALSNQTGFDWLSYADMRAGGNRHTLHGGQKDAVFSTHRQMVPVMRLDDLMGLVPWPPHWRLGIKLDVDGRELEVLKGMTGLLATDRIAGMIVEIEIEQEKALVEWLEQQGWAMDKRYDEREHIPQARIKGGKMEEVVYGHFVKALPVEYPPVPEIVGA